MTLSPLQTGENTFLIADTIVLVILSLMLVVSIRLWLDRRKKAYRLMSICLTFAVAQFALRFYFDLTQYRSDAAAYGTLVLKVVSFLLINLGIYRLYNPNGKRQRFLMAIFFTMACAVSLLHVFVPHWFNGDHAQMRLLQDLGLELFLFVIIFLSFTLVSPYIGQAGKYQAALTLYFTEQTAHVLNRYIFSDEQKLLTLLEHFIPAAFYFLLFMILFDRVVEIMQAIHNSSITDGLTRLYNRKFFENRLAQYLKHGYPVAVLFSDIDNFKKLNDTKGHRTGDEALKQVADILREESEECGLAGRFGGEEMVVLITDPSIKVNEFAEHIRRRVESETIVTVSLGFSSSKPGLVPEELIRQADEAMYKAKTTGKNKVAAY